MNKFDFRLKKKKKIKLNLKTLKMIIILAVTSKFENFTLF